MGNHFTSEVKLDHAVYFPGNVVRGTATIMIETPTQCLAARITCRGVERAICVTEGTQEVDQETNIFSEVLTLFGHPLHDHDKTPVEVPAGTYTYPFAFRLPANLPSSMRLTNWSTGGVEVRYMVTAYVKVASETYDEGHTEFAVVAPLNLKDAQGSQPATTSDLVRLSTFLAWQGTCGVTVNIKRSLFVPDETIEGDVLIDNRNGTIAVDNFWVTLTCHCDATIDKGVANSLYDLAGHATAEPIVRTRVTCHVAAGEQASVAVALRLPHVIQYASYPAKGTHYALVHKLVFDIAGKKIDVPLRVAQCCDAQNRFDFAQHDKPCYTPAGRVEYRYTDDTVTDGAPATPCRVLPPPSWLPPQPLPVASTPQAVGDGPL